MIVNSVNMVTLVCDTVKFENIKAVIFDKDGTLEDSRNFLTQLAIARSRLSTAQFPEIDRHLLKLFGVQNQTLDPSGLMAVGSRQENEIAAAALIASVGIGWFEAKTIVHHAFQLAGNRFTRNPQNAPLFSGCLSLLQSLKSAQVKLGIVSADSTAGIQKFVEDHNLSTYFEVVLGAEYGTKPNPALMIEACKRLEVKPQQTLMIGDAQGDMSMASAAEAAGAIAINWYSDKLQIKDADIIINHLDQIKISSLTAQPTKA